MAAVDQFLQGHVQGGLEPGERIVAMGLMRFLKNRGRSNQDWRDFFGVGTDRRLIVFDTETSGVFSPTARPFAHNPREYRYDELQRVDVTPVFGITTGVNLSLTCHRYLGPGAASLTPDMEGESGGNWDIFAGCDGLDSQGAFHAQFPTWLQHQVNGGAFPLPPSKRAYVESKIAERRAQIAAEQQRVLQRAAERDAKIRAGVDAVQNALTSNRAAIVSIGSLVAIVLVGLAIAGTGAIFMADPIEHALRGREVDDDEIVQLVLGAVGVVVSIVVVVVGLVVRKKVLTPRGPAALHPVGA
jgi:hypothetical protein